MASRHDAECHWALVSISTLLSTLTALCTISDHVALTRSSIALAIAAACDAGTRATNRLGSPGGSFPRESGAGKIGFVPGNELKTVKAAPVTSDRIALPAQRSAMRRACPMNECTGPIENVSSAVGSALTEPSGSSFLPCSRDH